MDYDKSKESADYILKRTKLRPKIGVICGSGLSALADNLEKGQEILYQDVPNFPVSTAPGHKSRLLIGRMNNVEVVIMQGRFHLYEGYSIQQCAAHVRVLYLMGIKGLIVTNAAGGLGPDLDVGDVMILNDHVNFMSFVGVNPLNGSNDERFGSRFFTLDDTYDEGWRKIAKEVVKKENIEQIKEGVYAMLGGPNFETPAELRLLKLLGVDAV